jgi:hypothetical protein
LGLSSARLTPLITHSHRYLAVQSWSSSPFRDQTMPTVIALFLVASASQLRHHTSRHFNLPQAIPRPSATWTSLLNHHTKASPTQLDQRRQPTFRLWRSRLRRAESVQHYKYRSGGIGALSENRLHRDRWHLALHRHTQEYLLLIRIPWRSLTCLVLEMPGTRGWKVFRQIHNMLGRSRRWFSSIGNFFCKPSRETSSTHHVMQSLSRQSRSVRILL